MRTRWFWMVEAKTWKNSDFLWKMSDFFRRRLLFVKFWIFRTYSSWEIWRDIGPLGHFQKKSASQGPSRPKMLKWNQVLKSLLGILCVWKMEKWRFFRIFRKWQTWRSEIGFSGVRSSIIRFWGMISGTKGFRTISNWF